VVLDYWGWKSSVNDAATFMSLLVNREKIRPVGDFFLAGVNAMNSLQCIDTVCYVTGRASGTKIS